MRTEFLAYCRPVVEDDDVAAVADAMRRGWLTTGPKAKELETAFAAACGTKHAVALNSCTAGLHLGLIALGVKPGDEVVMPSLSFVAGAQCARHLGAVPVFCDVEQENLCCSVETIDRVVTSRTRVMMPMHFGGAPAGVRRIAEYARAHGIAVLEDAAHAAGTLDEGRWPGSWSDAAVYSFYATKNLSSGEGGMFVTNDDILAERIRGLSLHGMTRDAWKRYTQGGTWHYDVNLVGYKYNMPDVLAALALSQLKKLDAKQRRRHEIAARYLDALTRISGIIPVSPRGCESDRHSWCVFAVLVKREAGISRDDLIDKLRAANIGTSVHFIPTHRFSAYAALPHASLSVTEEIAAQLLSLPLYPGMSDRDVSDVIDALAGIVNRASELPA